jgi:hypothetical protein
MIDKLVTALNAGDAPTAIAELCSTATGFASQVTDAASGSHSYHVTQYRGRTTGVDADIDGTHNGRQVKVGTTVVEAIDGSPGDCLLDFTLMVVG